jgi:hypothetical protein
MGYLSKIVSRSAGKNIRPAPAKITNAGDFPNDIIEKDPEYKLPERNVTKETSSFFAGQQEKEITQDPVRQEKSPTITSPSPLPPSAFNHPELAKPIRIPAMNSPVLSFLKPATQIIKQEQTALAENQTEKSSTSVPPSDKPEDIIIKKVNTIPKKDTEYKAADPEIISKPSPAQQKEIELAPFENPVQIKPNVPPLGPVKNFSSNQTAEGKITIGKILVEVTSNQSPIPQKERRRSFVSSSKSNVEKASKLSFGLGQL